MLKNGYLIGIKRKLRIRTRVKKSLVTMTNGADKLSKPITIPLRNSYVKYFGKFYQKKILFIFGVQRSGTTALFHFLRKDKRIQTYNEFSELSVDGDEKLRLHPYPRLKKQFDRNLRPILLLKPLVESQNANRLLEEFPNSRGIWIYRNYKDVANSNLNKFGINNGIKNLTPLMNGDSSNWRSENVSDDIKEIVAKYFSSDMKPHDAAALFWYVRSSFYYSQGLNNSNRILLMRYESFVKEPYKKLSRVYQFLGEKIPETLKENDIHGRSIKKGEDINLSPEIEALCDGLYQKFEKEYSSKNNSF